LRFVQVEETLLWNLGDLIDVSNTGSVTVASGGIIIEDGTDTKSVQRPIVLNGGTVELRGPFKVVKTIGTTEQYKMWRIDVLFHSKSFSVATCNSNFCWRIHDI